MNKKPEPIESKKVSVQIKDTTPKWVKESRRGWAGLIRDIRWLLRRAPKKVSVTAEPSDGVVFSYYDVAKIIIVIAITSTVVVGCIKLMQFLWSW